MFRGTRKTLGIKHRFMLQTITEAFTSKWPGLTGGNQSPPTTAGQLTKQRRNLCPPASPGRPPGDTEPVRTDGRKEPSQAGCCLRKGDEARGGPQPQPAGAQPCVSQHRVCLGAQGTLPSWLRATHGRRGLRAKVAMGLRAPPLGTWALALSVTGGWGGSFPCPPPALLGGNEELLRP